MENNPILKAALDYMAQGFCPVVIPPRAKAPEGKAWPDIAQRVTSQDAHYYFKPDNNIGLLLGYGGIFDIDCDCPEARTAAELVLIRANNLDTGFVFGRESTPRAHYVYKSQGAVPSTKRYEDPAVTDEEKATIVEFRGCTNDGSFGLQTVVPPSTHRDTSETIRFEVGVSRVPALVDADEPSRWSRGSRRPRCSRSIGRIR